MTTSAFLEYCRRKEEEALAAPLAGFATVSEEAGGADLLSFGNAIVSAAALLVRGSATGTPGEGALKRLLLSAPFDFVATGAAAVVARSQGTFAFLADLQAGAVWKP